MPPSDRSPVRGTPAYSSSRASFISRGRTMLRRVLFVVFLSGFALAQEPAIQVTGAVKQPLALTTGDLAKMPRTPVHASSHGTRTTYEGVRIHEILKKAGVPLGENLRGKALSSYVLVEGQDGYQVVFS